MLRGTLVCVMLVGQTAVVELPDLSTVPPDLVVPAVTDGPPAVGKRVRWKLPEDAGTDVRAVLSLPTDWEPNRQFPVIVEYPGNGNYKNTFGDVSDGTPEGCVMGYGLTGGKGAIWIALPFIAKHTDQRSLAVTWWGDVTESQCYCRTVLDELCTKFGGDRQRVFFAGFSRGAIAGNFFGLHDDEFSRLWAGFFLMSHYDGVRSWPYPGADRESALVRLKRLGARPQFIAHEGSMDATRDYLTATGVQGEWTFQSIPYRNHSAGWLLRPTIARTAARDWWERVSTRKLTGQ